MRHLLAFFRRLAGSFRRASQEQDLAEEFESCIALHTEDNMRAGLPPAEARRQAILHFGGVETARAACRDRLGLPALEAFLYDTRHAGRLFARNTMFTAVVVGTLGCGIGAATAMFMVARSIVMPRLEYRDPSRLVALSDADPKMPSADANVSSADFADWQRMNTVFSAMAAYAGIDERGKVRYNLFLRGGGEARLLKGLAVSPGFLEVLGTAPLLGRGFGTNDMSVVLTYDCFESLFGADPHILGRFITLSNERRQVVGVMPRGFFFPTREVDVFVPSGNVTPDRVFHDLGVIARLRPDVSLEQARTQMAAIGRTLARAFPESNAKVLPRVEGWTFMLWAARRPALLMMLAAVAVLFLLVCSNIAHLQLARSAARTHEFTIRKALGAGSGRLFRQLLSENLWLSVCGGALGLLVAKALCAILLQLAPAAIPLYANLRTSAGVVLFNVAITLFAPLLFGIGPALSSTGGLRLGQRAGSPPKLYKSMRDALVSFEVALSVVLVVCAGLLVRSLIRLEAVDLGFRTEHALSFRLDLADLGVPEELRARQIAEIERRLVEQHGIQGAGGTARPLLGGGSGGNAPMTIQGREQAVRLELVTPGYFPVMHVRLLGGRFPEPSAAGADTPVVVNAAFQRTYFPDGNAVGKQVKLGARGWATIAGVVSDLKQEALDRPAEPAMFVSARQLVPPSVTFVVRGTAEPAELAAGSRHAVHAVNAALPLTDVATLDERVRESVGGRRLRAMLLAVVGGAALLLAALGIYGVLAYAVAQRTVEISIRRALGARSPGIFRMILLDGMRPVAIGAGAGLLAAHTAGRLLGSLLFGTLPGDPATYLLTVVLLATIAVLSCVVPAWRAVRLEPVAALRTQ